MTKNKDLGIFTRTVYVDKNIINLFELDENQSLNLKNLVNKILHITDINERIKFIDNLILDDITTISDKKIKIIKYLHDVCY